MVTRCVLGHGYRDLLILVGVNEACETWQGWLWNSDVGSKSQWYRLWKLWTIKSLEINEVNEIVFLYEYIGLLKKVFRCRKRFCGDVDTLTTLDYHLGISWFSFICKPRILFLIHVHVNPLAFSNSRWDCPTRLVSSHFQVINAEMRRNAWIVCKFLKAHQYGVIISSYEHYFFRKDYFVTSYSLISWLMKMM